MTSPDASRYVHVAELFDAPEVAVRAALRRHLPAGVDSWVSPTRAGIYVTLRCPARGRIGPVRVRTIRYLQAVVNEMNAELESPATEPSQSAREQA